MKRTGRRTGRGTSTDANFGHKSINALDHISIE